MEVMIEKLQSHVPCSCHAWAVRSAWPCAAMVECIFDQNQTCTAMILRAYIIVWEAAWHGLSLYGQP